jgi:hypothetical protein
LALEGWFEKPKNRLFGHVRVKYTVKNKWAINFENVRIMCLSWMKCQYAHCWFIDLINYNWRCCSSTRQTPSSHQSVTRDDIADIIAHLVLIANTHCMSWLPWNDAISLKTLYFANQGSYYQPGLILPTRAHITNQGSYYPTLQVLRWIGRLFFLL